MTALNIYRTAKTSPRGPIEPMCKYERESQRLYREREKEKRNERH